MSRKRISWLGATLLSLYHLHITEAPSNLGFYHWRTDVARLIATHWSDIFGPAVKKKKTWQVSFFSPFSPKPPFNQGSVSGSLSGNASTLFESGLCTTGEQGWWRLRSLDPPALQLSRLAPKVVARCIWLWKLMFCMLERYFSADKRNQWRGFRRFLAGEATGEIAGNLRKWSTSLRLLHQFIFQLSGTGYCQERSERWPCGNSQGK